MAKKVEIHIEPEDVEFIMGENYQSRFNVCVNSVWCSRCKNQYQGKIVNYQIFLNEIGDIILEGSCSECSNRVARYIETGENKESYEKAMHVREVKMNLLKDYKRRKK